MYKPYTKVELNKLLRTFHPQLRLSNLGGLCHFYSNDDALGLLLCDTPSVYCDHWSQLTLEQWKEEAKDVLNQINITPNGDKKK